MAEFEVDLIFHLAALLSTRSEFTPMPAHQVNVEGTLQPARVRAARSGVARPAGGLLYPSSIAAYGMPDLGDEGRAPARSSEDEYLMPTTMYGCNKLYCEQLGATTRATTSSSRRNRRRRGRFPLRALPGFDLGASRCRPAGRPTTRPR